jgi:hypothetical protein
MCDAFTKALQHYPVEFNGPLICGEPDAAAVAEMLARHLSVLVPVDYFARDTEKWTVNIIDAQHAYIRESWRSTVLGLRSARYIEPNSVAFLAGHYASILRESKGAWTLHATVVERNGRAHILTGPHRTGKTALALLLREEFGFSIIASNYTLVNDDGNCVGGTAGLTVRRPINSVIRSPFPVSLQDDFELELVERIQLPAASVPVEGIVFLTSWPTPLRWRNLADPEIMLFEAFSQMPRSVIVLNEPPVATAAFDAAENNQRRYDFVRRLARSVPVVDVAGPVREQARWFVETCTRR